MCSHYKRAATRSVVVAGEDQLKFNMLNAAHAKSKCYAAAAHAKQSNQQERPLAAYTSRRTDIHKGSGRFHGSSVSYAVYMHTYLHMYLCMAMLPMKNASLPPSACGVRRAARSSNIRGNLNIVFICLFRIFFWQIFKMFANYVYENEIACKFAHALCTLYT